MRKTIIGATFVLLSAGASSVGALSGVALQGSDTLEQITKDVLDQCPAAKNAPGSITYAGGGSTTGGNAMIAGSQTVSPQSRPLSTSEGCSGGGAVKGTAEGLAIALDGLSIVAASSVGAACPAGLAFSNANVVDVVDSSGNPAVGCPGCDMNTNQYKFTSWKDVLALVYGGQHHDAAPTRDCNSNVRRSLVNSWNKLFEGGCNGAACTQLKHAFRRSDLSGTTDTFLSLVGLPSMPAAKTVSGASARVNPFCNAFGAGSIFGGDADYLDRDPIRRPCEANEQVCAATKDLGLVQSIEVPANLTVAENYATDACTPGRFIFTRPLPVGQTGVTTCPNGKGLLFGKCFQPVRDLGGGNVTAHCLAPITPVQGFAGTLPDGTRMDGRAYNQFIKNADGSYKRDNLGRVILGAAFRLHTTRTIAAGAATCQQTSSTDQIGCLTQANPCTIGFAGREATGVAPGIVALKVNGLEPTQANIEALVRTPSTADDYVLSRKLYFNTLVGFENVTGGELELAKCMSDNAIVGPIADARKFLRVPVDAAAGLNGVFCESFREGACDSPATGTNANSCTNNPAGVAQ
jgi:hypothetical protein